MQRPRMQADFPLKTSRLDPSLYRAGVAAGMLCSAMLCSGMLMSTVAHAATTNHQTDNQMAIIARPLLVNGTSATTTQVPWQAALFAQNSRGEAGYVCSGSLIDKQWVLTAAHCFNLDTINRQPITDYYIAVGTVDLEQITSSDRLIRVDRQIIYPAYNATLNLDNDIALLRLAQPVDIQACGMRCGPIAWLQPEQARGYTALGQPAQIAGWGETVSSNNDRNAEIIYPSRLQVGQFNIVNCVSNRYIYNNQTWPVSANMMCAQGADQLAPADTCVGDSGSGLVVNAGSEQPLLAGITSWGEEKPCGERTQPGVYTRVANYASWILSYVDPQGYALQQARQAEQPVSSSGSGSGGGGSSSLAMLLGLAILIGIRRKWLVRAPAL